MLWRRPYALLLFPPLFWAGNLLVGRAFAGQLPPLGLAFWRWVVASAILLPFVWRELYDKRRELLAHWRVILACGASGYAVYPVLNYYALQTTPAATASILNSMLPLIVPLLAWAITRDAPSPRTLAGIVVSFAGVAWIVGQGRWPVLAASPDERRGGEALVLAAVAGFALYSVLLRYRPKTVSDRAFLAAMTLSTSVLLLPGWAWETAAGRPMPLAPYAVGSVLFIGIFASLLATVFWNRCVDALGPTLTGASFHLMPVYSSVLAAVLLGEPIRVFHLVGISLILCGFLVAVLPRDALHRKPRKSQKSPQTGASV
jgi:drug/metabolite transporter (DMT)-like permease